MAEQRWTLELEDALMQMRKAVLCLYVQVPEEVARDVERHYSRLATAVAALNREGKDAPLAVPSAEQFWLVWREKHPVQVVNIWFPPSAIYEFAEAYAARVTDAPAANCVSEVPPPPQQIASPNILSADQLAVAAAREFFRANTWPVRKDGFNSIHECMAAYAQLRVSAAVKEAVAKERKRCAEEVEDFEKWISVRYEGSGFCDDYLDNAKSEAWKVWQAALRSTAQINREMLEARIVLLERLVSEAHGGIADVGWQNGTHTPSRWMLEAEAYFANKAKAQERP